MIPKLKIIDRGWTKIVKGLAGMKIGKVAAVGVQGSAAGEDHGGLTNATLAAYHEYGGNPNPPERSFLRSTMDDNKAKYDKELEKIAKGIFEGGGTLEGHLLLLGEQYRADVIEKIRTSIPPPLSPYTIAQKKGETTALIDTGQLLNSLSVQVKNFDEVEQG